MEDSWHIEFTKYTLPDGAQNIWTFPTTSEELKNKAEEIIKAGFMFDIETVSTGEVIATIADPDCGVGEFSITNGACEGDTIIGIEEMIVNFDIDSNVTLRQEIAEKDIDHA